VKATKLNFFLIEEYFEEMSFEDELATLPGKYAPPDGDSCSSCRIGEDLTVRPQMDRLIKVGGELKWKIAPGVFGLLFKGNGTRSKGTVGIGLYLGWDQ